MRTLEQKQLVTTNVRSTVATYIVYWHKLCLDITVFLSTVMIGIGTFVLTRTDTEMKAKIGAALFLAALAIFGCFIIVRAAKLLEDLRQILVKVDKADGLFEQGEYVNGTTVYPSSWEVHDEVSMGSIPWACILVLACLCILIVVFLLK